ncbi:MAG TPA: polyprenyl synthetase family protein [Thermoplasmata archaeon]|nr:polyprenyl synthetase family protein [Thermoplasmata archaeon]
MGELDDLLSRLRALREVIRIEAELVLAYKMKEAAGIDREVVDLVRLSSRHAFGGKMLREALMVLGYEAAGGKDREAIVQASTALTFLQAYLLVHDDIMDRAELRRKEKSAWKEFEDGHRKRFPKRKEHRRYGDTTAIIVGDLFESWAVEALAMSRFPPELRARALATYARAVERTGYGQHLDVLTGEKEAKDVLPEDVEKVHHYKTAMYTIDAPVRLGMVLAGASDDLLSRLEAFTIPLGVAFQIRDDVIDVFGDEKELGKEPGGDLKEGKRTLLVLHVLENGDGKQKKAVIAVLGKKGATKVALEKARGAIEASGAREASMKRAEVLFQDAMKGLGSLGLAQSPKKELGILGDYLIHRSY